jgi:PKD repeat protein
MNTEQINRFDELMREKLGSYKETEPDMDLLVNIHARKNRFLRLRNLYTLIIILAIVSAGIVGGYYLLGNNQSKQQQPGSLKSTNEKLMPAYSSLHGEYNQMNNLIKANNNLEVDGKNMYIHANRANLDYKYKKQSSKNNQDIVVVRTQAMQKQVDGGIQENFSSNSKLYRTALAKNKEAETTKTEIYNTEKTDVKQTTDACKVEIDYYTTYDNGYNFIAKSQNQNVELTWLFGDGKSSREQSPKHVYQKAGQYAVTLIAVNKRIKCKAETYTLVQVKQGVNLTSSTISGTVFADAEYATKTRVDLLVYNTTTNVYELAQSAFTNSKGFYEFNEIIEGNYLIKAGDYRDYNAAYYGNTTDREYANSVAIFANDYKELTGYDIQLTNNRLNALNNRNNADTGSFKWMLVFDKNNNPVASVLVNAEGKIQSSVDLPEGNYNLMDPSTGKSTGKLNVGADGIKIGTTDINTGKAGVLAPEPMQELVLMPNPATYYVKVSLTPSNSHPIHVKIVNNQGALVQSITLENGIDFNNINISALPVGTYYVVVSQNGHTTSSRLVKTMDSSK